MLKSNDHCNPPSFAGCFFFLKDSAPHLPGKSLLVLHAPSHVTLIRNFSLIALSLLPSTLVSYQAQPTHYYFYYFVIIMNYYHHHIHHLSGAYEVSGAALNALDGFFFNIYSYYLPPFYRGGK